MSRPRLLDLFCGAGGAAMGYHRAGFDVTGVDIEPQPRYPFEFVQADAMTFPLDEFDAYHASPPCQDHMRSRMRDQKDHGTGWMLDATRKRLQATGKPWVLENVAGAPMRVDIELCGCSVDRPEIERKRWFETSPPLFLLLPPCYHPVPIVNPMRTKHGPWYRKHGRIPTRTEVAEAFGVPWMRGEEIKQAVPPAYTELIGAQLLDYVAVLASARPRRSRGRAERCAYHGSRWLRTSPFQVTGEGCQVWTDHDLCGLIRSREAARLRVHARISQETMAAALGIARPSFSRLENGRHRPHPALAGRYARVLRGLANHEAGTRAWLRAF